MNDVTIKYHPFFFFCVSVFSLFICSILPIPLQLLFYLGYYFYNFDNVSLFFIIPLYLVVGMLFCGSIYSLSLSLLFVPREVMLFDNRIIIQIFKHNKIINISNIISVKKSKCLVGLSRYRDYYDSCILFVVPNEVRFFSLSYIPFTAIFSGPKEKVQKTVEDILKLLNIWGDIVDPELIDTIKNSNTIYQRYGHL